MTKVVLQRFPKEVQQLIWEYARDDSKAKYMIKYFVPMVDIWKRFQYNRQKNTVPKRQILRIKKHETSFESYQLDMREIDCEVEYYSTYIFTPFGTSFERF